VPGADGVAVQAPFAEASAESNASPDAQAPFASEPELPAGWEAAESRGGGWRPDTYFVNSLTGESTYDRPTAPAAEVAGAVPGADGGVGVVSEAAGVEPRGEWSVTKCQYSSRRAQ
jgi:hypothetical protein